ncbi:MAG: alpha/beta hydrolase [Pedosphaera sp. Tous-C6FEB]|nr:MAG: alpha/beta hydrolase [Pedosphaera sp. Tous-C6FEB]
MTESRPEVKPALQTQRLRWRRWLTGVLLAGLLTANVVAWLHARAMSRFVRSGARTASPEKLGTLAKARVLLAGVTLPRPENQRTPADAGLEFRTVSFPGAKGIQLEAWFVPATPPSTNGVVLLFHGYGASKDSLLRAADEFRRLGWDTLLVDFHGSGGSAGDTTSVGWHEAEDVAAAFAEAGKLAPGKPRVLYGVSMGAAACLRAIHTRDVKPDALILECPFDRMLTTVQRRFHAMRLPSLPFAELLVFWGGRLGGFNAFAHNPMDYAPAVRCPTLVLHGAKDPRVSVPDVERVYEKLGGGKTLKVFPNLGHQSYLEADANTWGAQVKGHLARVCAQPNP